MKIKKPNKYMKMGWRDREDYNYYLEQCDEATQFLLKYLLSLTKKGVGLQETEGVIDRMWQGKSVEEYEHFARMEREYMGKVLGGYVDDAWKSFQQAHELVTELIAHKLYRKERPADAK